MKRILEEHRIAVLGAIVLLAFLLRVDRLSAAGFSEDEAHKVEAGRAYQRGHFFVNLEHPMFMKEMIALSLIATDAWNKRASPEHRISEETAVRLPNAVFGSLMVIVIFLLAQEMFDFSVGLASAGFWATGVAAIMINRVAKEDTMLVFFSWLGYYFSLKARNLGSARIKRQEGFFALSGASFGLMLASKYFPHYFGLNALYYHLIGRNETNQPMGRRNHLLMFGAMALMFVLANPLIAFPSVLKYMASYASQEMMTHHGYFMMGSIYGNEFWYTPGSVPIYYYVLFLLLKTPLPVFVAFIIGLVIIFKQWRHPGHFFLALMFVLWLVPFSLVGGKFFRYALSLMPTVYIMSAVGILKVSRIIASRLRPKLRSFPDRALVIASLALFFIAPLWSAHQSAPLYSLYLNPLAQGRVAYFFPHDEIYDAGLRETIEQICETAPIGATVGGESPSVFHYYFHKFGRKDLQYFSLSDPQAKNRGLDGAYLIVQDGRRYFENISLINALKNAAQVLTTVKLGGATAATVYMTQHVAQNRSSP
jgi:hypothetical protein